MSRYSPRRQDGSSRTYHEPTTATSRQYPLSSRSFGTADNSPGKTHKRNSPLTERGSPVSGASSFSAGRSSSSRKNDTAETPGESPTKPSKASFIPHAANMNRDGTSSFHSRLSSRSHQDNTTSKTDSSHSGEHKHSRLTTESNLPPPRRKFNDDSPTKRDSSHSGLRSMGRGQSESPSRSSQESDGGSPSNIPLRTSYRRSLEGEKSNDTGVSRLLLRGSTQTKTGSGKAGNNSAESVDVISSRTQKDSKLLTQKNKSVDLDSTTTTTHSLLLNKNEKYVKDETSSGRIKSPSPTTNSVRDTGCITSNVNSKIVTKSESVSKALSPPRSINTTFTKQAFDRSDIKYNSCRSRIPTPNSPSGSRKGSESPVRQKLSSHSFSVSRTTDLGNSNNDDTGSSKESVESRADRIARYKDLRRRELASKIKSKLDPETNNELEVTLATKTANDEKSKYASRQAEIIPGTESSTAAKASAARSATADSTKIICGLKVSKNIADRAKKRQERMLRNSQHLSAELIGRRAKIDALCLKTETSESTESQKATDSLRPDTTLTFSHSKNQLHPSPIQEMGSLSPSSLSLSDNERDSYQQLTSESDVSPGDKRQSLTELESLPEITSSNVLNLSPEPDMVISDKRISVSELSPTPEEVLSQNEEGRDIGLPPEGTIKTKQDSAYVSETVPQESKPMFHGKQSLKHSPDKDTQHKLPGISPPNLSSSFSYKTVEKAKSPIGNTVYDSNITNVSPVFSGTDKKDSEFGNFDFLSKSSLKMSELKDNSSSYASSITKPTFHEKLSTTKSTDIIPENRGEQEVSTTFGKLRPRPPASTVLYTKKLLESGNVKKDQKRVDYDLQKELDWLEHRKYQYADENNEQNEKKLSVLEMVRAREGKMDTDEEKPRKPLGRTMSEARGKDAAQSRREILAARISNLGRTRSFGMAPNKRLETSDSIEEKSVLPNSKDNYLDELLMKNVAYLDDENLPKDPLVRSLHPGENLKLRKSLRKKKLLKLSDVPEKEKEDKRITSSLDENVAEEIGALPAEEITESKATLKFQESSSSFGPVPPTYASSFPSNINAPESQNVSPEKPVSQSIKPQVVHVVQKPTRPTLAKSHLSETAPKQLHVTQPPGTKPLSLTVAQSQISDNSQKYSQVTQPPTKKPVSSTVVQNQISDTSKKQLHVTQPPTKKPVSPTIPQNQVSDTTKKQSPVTQSPVTKLVSPAAAVSYKVSNATTRELPTSQDSVPAQTDIIDSPQRKCARSQSRGKPEKENLTDLTQIKSVLKKSRDKDGSNISQLGALDEHLDTKDRGPNQELSPPGLTATEKSTALPNFENSNTSAGNYPPVTESTTQSRRSRQRVRPEDIPAPILDVIKASLDYEQNGTQSKAEPCRTAQLTQPKLATTNVSASTKTVLDKPLAPVQPCSKDELPRIYSPVISRRLSDVNKSTLTTVNQLRMNEDIDVSITESIKKSQSLKPRADSLGSGTAPPSAELKSHIRKASLPENNNSSKTPFHATDVNFSNNIAKNLSSFQERRQSPITEEVCTKDSKNKGETYLDDPSVTEKIPSKKAMPTRSNQIDEETDSTTSGHYQQSEGKNDISKVSVKDFTNVELFIREDSDPMKKVKEVESPESSFLSTSKLSLKSKAADPISSQMRKPISSIAHPDDRQPQKTVLSSEVKKLEISSAKEKSTVSQTLVTNSVPRVTNTISSTTVTTSVSPSVTSAPQTPVTNITSAAVSSSSLSKNTIMTAKTITSSPEIRTTSTLVNTGSTTSSMTTMKTDIGQEVKQPSVMSTQVTTNLVKNDSVRLTSASVTTPISKIVTASVTSVSPEAKSAVSVTSVAHGTSIINSTPVTTGVSSSVTSTPQRSVTSVTCSESLDNETKKPEVKLATTAQVTNTVSSPLVTATTVVKSVPETSVSTATKTVTKASEISATSNKSNTTVTTMLTTANKTSVGSSTEVNKYVIVTSSTSVTKSEPVRNVSSTSTTTSVTQTSSVTTTKSIMTPRSVSLSPTLPDNHNLSKSMELTQKDIENGNLMTRSAQFSQPRMSDGSINIPRRGILKRTGSLHSNNINSELIDPELAMVFQARRIKEHAEQPTSDLAEEDSVFNDKPQCQEALWSETINEESEEKVLSVAERISHMETRISISTSGCATPKTPRSRLGSVPRMLPENKKSILPQEELFNKLTDLARSKEATQERQKRYQRSRDDWRTRTQPVTLKEVEQADSLESVYNFRALVMKRSSINIFEQLKEQDKRRRCTGYKTEYPQPYVSEKRNRKNLPRYKTLPVTAEELMAIPEGETISLEILKSKMLALKESKTDSGIVSSSSDIEKDSQGSDSVRSLTTDNDDDDFTQMSVAARASLFRQMEEKCKKSASGAKRYIDRKKRERSRTQPITEEEVKTASEIADEEASRKQSVDNGNAKQQNGIEMKLDVIDEPQAEEENGHEGSPVLTLEKLIESDSRAEEKDITKHSDELTRQTLADKVKLFSSTKQTSNEKPTRTDAPVIRRRNRRVASRFNTQAHRVSQPITSEEMENVFRISPLAISLVKPPDPDILKGLPLNAQRELTAQYAEACLSQQGSRAGSRASSRPGSQAGSRRGSIEESEDSKAETKGILKMADYQKDLQQLKSILKTESGRESPEREIRSILKNEGERKDSEPSRSILKQDSNEQAKLEGETKSILKSSEPEPRRSSKQLDLEPRGILKVPEQDVCSTTPKASEPKSVLKKDSNWDKNGSEPRGILKKESSFDLKKEPEKGVLKRFDSKESKEMANQDNIRGILKKDSSIENLSSEDSDITDVLAKAEEMSTPVLEGKKKEYRRGSDERYLTQPVTDIEKKSPETPRKLQRYGSRQHKTQPITPEEKKEATQVIQPVIKMSGSLAERLQALQKSGEEDWKKRLSKQTNSANSSPDREIQLESPDTTPVRPANLSERMSQLKSSQSSWRSRIEESDAKAFTVEGKLSKSGQIIRERSVVTKLKQTVKSTETDESTNAASPTSPTKGEWKIPIPTQIIASETTFEETTENSTNIVKLPELKDEGLDQFFGSSTNLVEKSELLDISVDDFDEIFQISQNLLIHSAKARPKKKVQARSKNPLKSRSVNLERQEYEEYKTNVAEIELKRMKKEALSKDAGFAEAALAGLASKENFSKIELRKTDTSVPSPGGHRYLPYKPLMLIHVKGRRHVQTRLVEPCSRNVNQGDCYVLVTPDNVINWIGEYSNIIEKAKSADIAAHIQQKKDMGYKSSSGVITIDSKKTSSSMFWSLLDGHESECQECGGTDEDEIYENAIISTNMIYKIEKNMLVPYEEYWGSLPKYEMLQSNQIFIFDFGAEVYIWQGKKVLPQKRKIGLELAQQLWDKGYNYEMSSINPLSTLQGCAEDSLKCLSGQRPSWSLIAKVNENMETVLFREKFADWPDSTRLIKVKAVDSNSNKTENGDLIPYDAQKLIDKEPPEALLLTLDGSQVGRGTYWSEDMGGFIQEFEINTLAVTVWHILEFDHYKLEPLSNGQFHEGDTYVVRWEYRIIATGGKISGKRSAVGRERCAYFFWQGQKSTITEKGASALMTVELDEERGPQVRVLQGKEPPCFLNLFQGQMVVHIGKREEEETNTQGPWRLYSVRHEKQNEMCLIEIQAQISSLRSQSSFILFNVQTGKVFIWHGAKSPQNTRTLALNAVNSIQERHPLEMCLPENINTNITEMNEGSEKPEFWMALRSRDRSQYMSLLKDPRSFNFSLRLFQFTSVFGVIDVTEIRNPTITKNHIAPYPFLQSDLYKVSQPALFLLDNGYEVYVWQGWWPEGDEEIENVLTGSAQTRLMAERRCAMQTAFDYCQAKSGSTPIKPYLVYAGLEPMKFINVFPFWEVDETAKELSLKDGKCDGDLISVEDELNRLSLVRYSFQDLLERPLPEDVDPLRLESYLSDEEFEEVLKMTKSEYYSLPAWKQSKLKQDIGLF